jgi:hypothetical protein
MSTEGAMYEIFIEWPARQIGNLALLIYLFASATGSIGAGYLVGKATPLRAVPQVGIVVGILVALYVGAILFRSQHYTAIALLEAIKD